MGLCPDFAKEDKKVNSSIKPYLLKFNHPKKKTMKHFFKLTILASVVAALIFGLSAFTPVKKANANVDSYQISLVDKTTDGANETWTWSLVNTNPANGNNGTLQYVSHFDIA